MLYVREHALGSARTAMQQNVVASLDETARKPYAACAPAQLPVQNNRLDSAGRVAELQRYRARVLNT
jgi:hypothetical protein